MSRHSDIRERIEPLIEILVRHYEETDPKNGEESSWEKLEAARHAFDIWWALYDDLMLWAQAHLTGYTILKEMPELVHCYEIETAKELDGDDPFLEEFGLVFAWNVPGHEPVNSKLALDIIERFDNEAEQQGFVEHGSPPDLLHPVAFRSLLNEFFTSQSLNSDYWRRPLQRALRELNEGQENPLFAPKAGRRIGLPLELRRWKIRALELVNFRVGLGFKKYKALEIIGRGIGQSTETLRSWEKNLKSDDECGMRLDCARLAGELKEQLEADPTLQSLDLAGYPHYRNRSYIWWASKQLRALEKCSLDEVREGIRAARSNE